MASIEYLEETLDILEGQAIRHFEWYPEHEGNFRPDCEDCKDLEQKIKSARQDIINKNRPDSTSTPTT